MGAIHQPEGRDDTAQEGVSRAKQPKAVGGVRPQSGASHPAFRGSVRVGVQTMAEATMHPIWTVSFEGEAEARHEARIRANIEQSPVHVMRIRTKEVTRWCAIPHEVFLMCGGRSSLATLIQTYEPEHPDGTESQEKDRHS